MAVREVLTVLQSNFNVDKTQSFHAGAVLAVRTTNGVPQVFAADRSIDTAPASVVGVAADDKARIGNTLILIDPVGSSVIADISSPANANGSFAASNNGYYVAPKRAIADYMDETVTNVSDLTSGATGYQGPRRGVGVYTTPSSQLITDQFVAFATASTTTDGTTPVTFATSDLLTYGVGVNAGKFIKIGTGGDGKSVARVDNYDASAGLIYITLL